MYTDRYMSYKGHVLVSYKGQIMGYDTYQEIKENEEKEELKKDKEYLDESLDEHIKTTLEDLQIKYNELEEITKLLIWDLRNKDFDPTKDIERAENFIKGE